MSRKTHIKGWNWLGKWILYTNIRLENTQRTIWLPHSIDLLLPIRNYRLPKEPFPLNLEICENLKICGKLKKIVNVCKSCEK